MHTIVKDPRRDDPKNFNFDYEETCPECENEVYIRRDPEDPTFSVVCPHCGKKLMLCSLCIDTYGDCYTKNGKCICEAEPRDITKQVICIYSCDQWQSRDSFRLIAVVDKEHFDSMLATIKRDYAYTDDDMNTYIWYECVTLNCYA